MTVLSARVADLMDGVTAWDAPVHGTHSWTVTDLVRHMSLLPEVYTDSSHVGPLAMSPTAEAMAETNAKTLEVAAQRPRDELAATFRRTAPVLVDYLRRSDPRAALPFHAGLDLTPGELGGIAIAEWLVHGWELARTIGAPWRVEPAYACLALAAMDAVVPAWLDVEQAAGHRGSYQVRLRGTGHRLEWTFADGVLTTRRSAGEPFRPDTIIWAEPAALLLYFFRRTGLWSNVARGALISGGRRPDRGLTMQRLFQPA